jgi:hypothetical protein
MHAWIATLLPPTEQEQQKLHELGYSPLSAYKKGSHPYLTNLEHMFATGVVRNEEFDQKEESLNERHDKVKSLYLKRQQQLSCADLEDLQFIKFYSSPDWPMQVEEKLKELGKDSSSYCLADEKKSPLDEFLSLKLNTLQVTFHYGIKGSASFSVFSQDEIRGFTYRELCDKVSALYEMMVYCSHHFSVKERKFVDHIKDYDPDHALEPQYIGNEDVQGIVYNAISKTWVAEPASYC